MLAAAVGGGPSHRRVPRTMFPPLAGWHAKPQAAGIDLRQNLTFSETLSHRRPHWAPPKLSYPASPTVATRPRGREASSHRGSFPEGGCHVSLASLRFHPDRVAGGHRHH